MFEENSISGEINQMDFNINMKNEVYIFIKNK
jgi:hypothetical protein